MVRLVLSLSILCLVFSCGQPKLESSSEEEKDNTSKMTQLTDKKTDNHSFSKPQNAVCSHLNLDIRVDFDKKVVSGVASYDINQPKSTGEIIFDIKSIEIEKITVDNDIPTSFTIEDEIDALHGQALKVKIEPETKQVNIYYSTTSGSDALQWLNPQQTSGKKHPFLFTQGQAILTRSWIPIQDSPGIRISYNAKVTVPKELMAIMSASNPQEKNNTGIYEFKLEQSIPSYLIALSVGDLNFRKIGDRTGVYTEPSTLDKCAKELEDLEEMVIAGEGLYGPYRWNRYDVIVLPPSFPFGGMENPMLTFSTPTIIAGDKSLVSLIAHELAHSWSGNLVTNHTWNDFWLNEGFTVYFENRIMETVYGKDMADMSDLLNYQSLTKTINSFGKTHPDTHLKLQLDGRNPDDGMNDIAYNKGALFLTNLEKSVGREKWDRFVTGYFNDFEFKTITTEEFVEYINKTLLEPNNVKFDINAWIYAPGLPENHIKPEAKQFEVVSSVLKAWIDGTPASGLKTSNWSTYEWLYFIGNLPQDITKEQLGKLDQSFKFTNSTNSEIAALWFEKSINADYMVVSPKLESFLVNVGRRKFLVPLYRTLLENGHIEFAEKVYNKARPNYHFVSSNTIDDLFSSKKTPAGA